MTVLQYGFAICGIFLLEFSGLLADEISISDSNTISAIWTSDIAHLSGFFKTNER